MLNNANMREPIRIVRPLRNGRITIPADFRRQLRVDEHTLLQVILVGNELHIRPVKVTETTQAGSAWARDLYEMFAPVRDEAAEHSETEVNSDIEKAITAVRRKRR
jgi:AbrB family looped-hinge helix DNA binding protein